MKKSYNTPEIRIDAFLTEDVITTSGTTQAHGMAVEALKGSGVDDNRMILFSY